MDRRTTIAVLIRVALAMTISLVGAWIISEVSYQLNRQPGSRDTAQRVELIIPAGTAAQVAAGQAPPGIPAQMTFLEGDLLVVTNQDSVGHQLGPVWVPPQSSGVLQIDTASDYSYSCSFTPKKYFDLNVLPRLTTAARVQGILAMGLPSGVMVALYSFLVVPLKKKESAAEVQP
jgi:hypothetical protein